ncbi:MAG: hypothetical protein JWQ72_523 [Polaromonas sp.]|nr:hypothetical protein [Polaromonas sp.]
MTNAHTHLLAARRTALLAAMFSALALSALPAAAQGTSGSGGGSTAAGSGAAGGSSSSGSAMGSAGSGGSTGAGAGPGVARADRSVMTDLAQANNAEIETGRLALEKSQNDQVKKFAQQMIDDHTSAQKELQALAQSKGVNLPEGTDVQHKTMATAMRALSGNTFDSQYVKRVGVNDHQRTLQLLKKAQGSKDADIKAMATKMTPTVQHHLEMAQQMASSMASAGSSGGSGGGTSGRSGSTSGSSGASGGSGSSSSGGTSR